MKKKNKTAIVILTFNNLDYNKNCLDSIRKHTRKGTYELIVVDNFSTDGTREWLQEQTDIKILLNDYNAGFPKGCNMGIELADPNSDILLLNNDTLVTSKWLDNLRKCLYSDNKIGAVGAVCNKNENFQGVDFTYDNFEDMQELAKKNNVSNPSKWEEKVFLIGFCLLIKREVLNKIGMLDEAYSPGYVEDNDYSLRIINAGYKLMLCHDCFIHHYLGTNFRKDLSKLYPILNKNRSIFFIKWGFPTTAFDDIKYASLRMLDDNKDKALKILELNCGIGVTLLRIKNDYPNAELYGIEPNIKMAEISSCVANIISKQYNQFPFDYEDNYFDYIIIGDALERLSDPLSFLNNIKRYLKDDGYIIGDIQNIMHYDIIKNLLRGEWLFANNNLKKDYYNYYTLDDLHRIFNTCSYKNLSVLHWYSVVEGEDEELINRLGGLVNESRLYLYKTHTLGYKAQKL